MYYKKARRTDLSKREMDLGRKAFRGKLVRLRFAPSFVINNSDELLAKAHGDFARALNRGIDVADPVGFTVHCAWRHTQNLLRSEDRTPASVSIEKTAELVDEQLPPDELVLADDRIRKVHGAVSKLNENQRKVVALVFFEDMSWREAARHLDWTPSKVQHHYEKAMEHLQRFLAVKSSDELVIDVGMAAWLSCAGANAHSLPGGFEALLDKASDGATGFWGKAHELARRLAPGGGGGGGEQIGLIASSGGGRALGTCATVAVACIVGAGAMVGPGIGISDSARHGANHRQQSPANLNGSLGTRAVDEASPEASGSTAATIATPKESPKRSGTQSGAAAGSSPHAEASRVKAQTSGIARAGAESSEPSSSTATSSGSGEGSEAEAVTVTSAPSPPPSAREEASAQKQFGAFK
jgi:RNA polymerase sigma factor (sigma-70 family)